MKKICLPVGLMFLLVVLGGCKSLSFNSPLFNRQASFSGVRSLVSENGAHLDRKERIDLSKLFTRFEIDDNTWSFKKDADGNDAIPGENEKKYLRNQMQNYLMAHSDQRCGSYSQAIKRLQSETGIIFGWSSVITAGLGSLITPVGTAQALSGSSAILNGMRGEADAALFNQLAAEVIVSGFEARRAKILEGVSNRQQCSVELYPPSKAVQDAIQYHESCSMVAGLQEAGKAIERQKNPGVEMLMEQLKKLSALKVEMQNVGAPAVGAATAGSATTGSATTGSATAGSATAGSATAGTATAGAATANGKKPLVCPYG